MRAVQTAAVLAATTLFLLLSGCRSVVPVPDQVQSKASHSGPIQQQVIAVIHGDGSYLYHDRGGASHQADEETLRETFAAAQQMPTAEVFVFHQRPANDVLGLFARDDGTFYHFRKGTLIRRTTYEQDRSTPFSAEATLVEGSSAPVDSSVFTAALYYGHAVPETPRQGYHRSRPNVAFGVPGLARGLGRLAGPGASTFDAMVLSTCDGGTPHTISELAPHVQHVLASPADLHLSYIDPDLLPTADATTDAGRWTRRLADRAFDRLTDRVHTAVTLATYDIESVLPTARRMAREIRPDTSSSSVGARHVDCQTVLDSAVDTTGVRTWDRPARFGPEAERAPHSGWGCVQ